MEVRAPLWPRLAVLALALAAAALLIVEIAAPAARWHGGRLGGLSAMLLLATALLVRQLRTPNRSGSDSVSSGDAPLEPRLLGSEGRWRALAEASFEGILISQDGRIVDANEQAASLFGYSVDDLLGIEIGRRVALGDRDDVRQRVRSGDERPYEVECYRRDRESVFLELRGKTLELEGRMLRVTAMRDITERRRLEAHLRQVQKMDATGQLAAGIAHDFRNLLTVITGRCYMLHKTIANDEEATAFVDDIRTTAKRAGDMAQQLLTFCHQGEHEPELLDLNATVADMESTLRHLIGKQVELRLDLVPQPCPVEADRSQLEQMIMNLAINARDAMPRGGPLSLTTSRVEVRHQRTAFGLTQAPGSYIELAVRDEGEGMAPETVERIFEPFFTTKEKGRGTGLGLATVYGVVRGAAGGLAVESTPGKGTIFRIFLPTAERSLKPRQSRHPLKPRQSR